MEMALGCGSSGRAPASKHEALSSTPIQKKKGIWKWILIGSTSLVIRKMQINPQ
jgi:hypothetical protein